MELRIVVTVEGQRDGDCEARSTASTRSRHARRPSPTASSASQLTESIGDALELDVFDIEAGTADGAIAPVLTLGEQFGDLWVRLRQRFGPDAVSQAVIEYRLAEWLRLQTTYSQGQSAARSLLQCLEQVGIDLLFLFRY